MTEVGMRNDSLEPDQMENARKAAFVECNSCDQAGRNASAVNDPIAEVDKWEQANATGTVRHPVGSVSALQRHFHSMRTS